MNKKILTAILISIALPGGMLSAPADSLRLKSYKLDEVVVTGTRNETDIRHLPMTISVVGRQQLEQTYQPSILPALTEQVPGLFTTSRGIMGYGVSTGAAGGMSLRGIGAGVNAAGGPTTSLLVLIDGHPQYMGLMGHPIADAYQSMVADRDGRLMSGGQMRRASLAIGIALNPGILLLDEPTANLDIATRREIMAVLEDMKDVIQTAVIATHDMQLVCQWAERIIVLCGGRVVADGSRDEIFARADVVEQVGIRPPEIFSMAQALDRRALCYTVEEFLSSFQEA